MAVFRLNRSFALPRGWIGTAHPIARIALGVSFVAYSSLATVVLSASDVRSIAWAMETKIGINHIILTELQTNQWYSLLIGVFLATVIFFGEILTAGRGGAYLTFLVPDTIYTARQSYPFFWALAMLSPWAFMAAVAVVVWVSAILHHRSTVSAVMMTLVATLIAAILILFSGIGFFFSCVISLIAGELFARGGEELIFGKRTRDTEEGNEYA